MTFRKVTHVIFDMDGLLLDTENLYTKVTQIILDKYKSTVEYTFEIKARLMGTQQDEEAKIIVDTFNLPITPDQYIEESEVELNTRMGGVDLLPGAERFIQHLHRHNIPFALATSSPEDIYQIKIQRHRKLFELFSHRVCGSSDPEVVNGKPAPDIFLVAANRFADKPDPHDCLVFEDAPNGVTAALAAGMQCVMVPHRDLPAAYKTKATVVLDNLEQTDLTSFGLPALGVE